MPRRKVLGVIGQGGVLPAEVVALARALGRAAVDAGFRVATGGLGGVMEGASAGAHESERYQEGDVIGVLPGYNATAANEFVDIVIPTGMGLARNAVVTSTADVIVAIAGGAGTLSELAIAWQLGKRIIALGSAGWAAKLAGEMIDTRRKEPILPAETVAEAISLALARDSHE